MAILWINLNFIELLTVLQFITIWNISDVNNIKPQATKRLVKTILITFYESFKLSKVQTIIILSLAFGGTKNKTCGPWSKKVVHLCFTRRHVHFQTHIIECDCPHPHMVPQLTWLCLDNCNTHVWFPKRTAWLLLLHSPGDAVARVSRSSMVALRSPVQRQACCLL